jgi:hypothetical protein
MINELFIPNKIKVGFQNRNDTYTKKLAYVIYYDQKNVLRKEKSWEAWRDKSIDSIDFDNEPIEGFVLNKGVGGGRSGYRWNVRNEYIRVYDPRDFEFEISVANLLFILRECNCSKGKGLEGKFVYAWDNVTLVLLPTITDDYQQCKQYTELQSKKIISKDLIPGVSYITKKMKNLVYLGRFNYYNFIYNNYSKNKKSTNSKKYIFWDGNCFLPLENLKLLAAINTETPPANFAELIQNFYNSIYGSKIVDLFLVDSNDDLMYWFYEESPGVFVKCSTNWDYGDKSKISFITMREKIMLKNNELHFVNCHELVYPPGYAGESYSRLYQTRLSQKWIEPTKKQLWARLESGQKYLLYY